MSVQELLVLESNTHSPGTSEGEDTTQPLMDVKNDARQAALTGRWDGTIHQEEWEPDHRMTLQLKLVGRTIRGEGRLHSVYQSRDLTQSVSVCGRCVYDRFLKLEYTLREPVGAIQFGFILLEFAPDGQALSGFFLGYGALATRGMVAGTVQLQRQETNAYASVTPRKTR